MVQQSLMEHFWTNGVGCLQVAFGLPEMANGCCRGQWSKTGNEVKIQTSQNQVLSTAVQWKNRADD